MARRPTNPTVHQALNAFTKTKPNHRTKSTSKLVMYARDGEPFGVVLSDEECNALSADELREAVKNYVHCFVRCPSAMRAGAALHLEHRPDERWWLSDGSEVAAVIAHLVIRRPDVASVGDSLFGFTPAQTYRFVETSERKFG